MGFFDDVKNSLTEKSQDLSKKAKDTTEIYRLNNANKSMEKEGVNHFFRGIDVTTL